MQDLIIFGASGFGREVAWLVDRINAIEPNWNLLGFMDDDDRIQGKIINGVNVIGKIDETAKYPSAYYVCAVGASQVRKSIISKLRAINGDIRFATLIDPSVEMSESVSVGEGTIICAHNILTVDIGIGAHIIQGISVGNDSIIGAGCVVVRNIESGVTAVGNPAKVIKRRAESTFGGV